MIKTATETWDQQRYIPNIFYDSFANRQIHENNSKKDGSEDFKGGELYL